MLDMQVGVAKRESNGPWFSKEGTNDTTTPGKELPTEDVELIRYEFFSKPMAYPLVILARSAIPEGTKVATMVAEIKRRWKNTWEGASTQIYEAITMKFMDNLAAMGYGLSWRKDVLMKALIGYMREGVEAGRRREDSKE